MTDTTTPTDAEGNTESELLEVTAAPTNVIQALACVMAEMGGIEKLTPQERKARGLSGGDAGDRGISYAYRSIDQIAAAAQPLLGKFGIVMAPRILSHEITKVNVSNGAVWDHHIMLVEYRIYGPGGTKDKIVLTVIGEGRDNSDKGANKAQTMAYKNALLRVLCIGDPADDPDHGKFVNGDPPPAGWWGGWVDQDEHEGVKARIVAKIAPLDDAAKATLKESLARIAVATDKPGGSKVGSWPLTVDEAAEFEHAVDTVIAQEMQAEAETGEVTSEPTAEDVAATLGGVLEDEKPEPESGTTGRARPGGRARRDVEEPTS